jgi:hypothetical protein
MAHDQPHARKVLIAISQAQHDSLTALELAKIVNQPGIEFLVLDGASSFASAIADSIRDQYALESGALLIQNPYDTSTYFREDEAVAQIALQKTLRIAQVCHLLGSTSLTVKQISSATDERQKHSGASGGAKGIMGRLSGDSKAVREIRQRIALRDTCSGGEPDIQKAEEYLLSQRLSNDTMLTNLVEARAVTNNTLKSRTLTIDATKEARSSLDIAAKVSAAVVDDMGGKGGKSAREFEQVNVEYEVVF